MAKTNRTAKIRQPNNDHDDDAPEINQTIQRHIEDDPDEQTYSAFIGGFSEAKGCRVKVHRQTPRGRQYCFTGTPEEIDSEETIRLFHAKQPYGHEEGLYYLSVEVNGELRNRFPVHIAPQVGTPGAEAVVQTNRSGGMADERLLSILDRMEQRLAQVDRPPMLDMVEGLARIDALRGGQQQQQLPMDTMMKAIELGTKMASAGVPTDDWSSLLREVLKENAPAIGMIISSYIAKNNVKPAEAPAAPGRAGVIEDRKAEPVAPSIPEEEAQLIQALKGTMHYLKGKAARNSDPSLYVDFIVDNREDPLHARLIREILDKDFSAFAAIDPEIQKPEYFGFFRFIYDGIRSVFDEANKMASAGSGKAGNKGNTSGNGAAGAKSK